MFLHNSTFDRSNFSANLGYRLEIFSTSDSHTKIAIDPVPETVGQNFHRSFNNFYRVAAQTIMIFYAINSNKTINTVGIFPHMVKTFISKDPLFSSISDKTRP